jgi:hypothetical protein
MAEHVHIIYDKKLFCMDLRTNTDYSSIQHKLIVFYNRDEKCLQRGTAWDFKSDRVSRIRRLFSHCKDPLEIYVNVWVYG